MPHSRRLLAGMMLIVVSAWALVAVLLLAGTLSAADSIERHIPAVRGALSGANQDLDYVRLTRTTVKLTHQIRAAASPLSTRLATEIRATRGIRTKVRSIDQTVFHINDTAHSIDAKVASIEGRVAAIDRNVIAIHRSALGIEADAGSILGHVRDTFASVLGINSRFVGVRTTAGSIDRGVLGINLRVLRATRIVRRIEDRLIAVLAQVGLGHGTPTDAPIHGHANSIDCRVQGSDCDR